MDNTSKTVCRHLAHLITAHGVSRVFASPGSRNAPAIIAAAREPALKVTSVVDERCAAFMALGYASVSGEPVALICTSGTALLNYAPAVAEAFYRKVPLIVITADRPAEWIDQDDSQTLRQPGALSAFVKVTCDITDRTDDLTHAIRQINDAMLMATTGRRAPVHINLRLDEPLGLTDSSEHGEPRRIELFEPTPTLTTRQARDFGARLASPRKVMIVAGFNAPDKELNQALCKIARLPNVTVLTETVANLHGPDFITAIDSTLSVMTDEEKRQLAPDAVITLGGALVSRHIKHYLRQAAPAEHWHVGLSHTTVDCLRALTLRVEMPAAAFFRPLASGMQPHRAPSDYAERWLTLSRCALSTRQAYVARAPWSDIKAMSTLLPMIAGGVNVQLSNGTAVRYAQLLAPFRHHRCDCNRGVSGIDGSTSTAIGAAMAYERPTLLITGDMSAQYDIGALANAHLAPRLRIAVMCNGGGGIFRFIESTSRLPELEERFVMPRPLPLRLLAEAYGLDYLEASDEAELRRAWPEFMTPERNRPAIMAINTPGAESAELLRGYFRRGDTYHNPPKSIPTTYERMDNDKGV